MAIPDKDSVREFWDSRAKLGEKAGTQDLIARQLEVRAIEEYVKDGMTILDAGCGKGTTAIELWRKYKVHIQGVDFSEKMIDAAYNTVSEVIDSDEEYRGSISLFTADITKPLNIPLQFDLVYTQRAIINLPDWETQKKTIELLGSYLKPGGLYLMCECSKGGLNQINYLRENADLAPIVPPWHNRYIDDEEIESLCYDQNSLRLAMRHDFSGTYYFLSRVVNAWLARREGKEPDYNAPVNQLALHLPSIDGFGQVKLWVWQRGDK